MGRDSCDRNHLRARVKQLVGNRAQILSKPGLVPGAHASQDGADVRMAEDEFERLLLGRVSQENLVVIEDRGPNDEPVD